MEDLVIRAERSGHAVFWYPLQRAACISLREDDGSCVIGIDPRQLAGQADARVKLAHELGHCETGAFYTRLDDRAARLRREVRADRWAIRQLIPYGRLCDAIARGCRTAWELADYFCVTQTFLERALSYYRDARSLPLDGIMEEA